MTSRIEHQKMLADKEKSIIENFDPDNVLPLSEYGFSNWKDFYSFLHMEIKTQIVPARGYVELMLQLKPEVENIVLSDKDGFLFTMGDVTDVLLTNIRIAEHLLMFGQAMYREFYKREL
ncbi:MAG: hypothetical protein HY862_08880 [Chloroflexi bacterium]|nr:hypothetical protein [Chloroflexota bacterium]